MQKMRKNPPIRAAGTRLFSSAKAGLAGISTADSASNHPIRDIPFPAFINVPPFRKFDSS
jgi:hypothetical protein